MKIAFKIFSFCLTLAIVSCEKDVLVPLDAEGGSSVQNSVKFQYDDGVISGESTPEITDPNDRGGKVNVVDRGKVVNITDPTDSGNSNGKKPKR